MIDECVEQHKVIGNMGQNLHDFGNSQARTLLTACASSLFVKAQGTQDLHVISDYDLLLKQITFDLSGNVY